MSLWKGLMSTGAGARERAGLCSWGAEERGTKWVCVFGEKGAGRVFSSFTSRARGAVVGAVPAQQRKQKAGTSASTVPSQWNSEFCCWQRCSSGRFLPALLTRSCSFLAPQRASLPDMGHRSFLSRALNEDGQVLSSIGRVN